MKIKLNEFEYQEAILKYIREELGIKVDITRDNKCYAELYLIQKGKKRTFLSPVKKGGELSIEVELEFINS